MKHPETNAPRGRDTERRKPTLRDIARLCNVSTMTVSMAINRKPGISKQTAERILKTIRELNYTPNMVAKSLRVSSTRTIGVLMSDSSQLLFTKLLKCLGDEAEAADYSIIMANTDQNPERERRAIDVLINKRIDGLVMAAPMLADDSKVSDVVANGIPLVMMMRTSAFDVDSVCADNYHGAHAMVDYLAASGSRRIAMINLPRESQSGRERLRGYRRALRDHGIKSEARLVRHVPPQIADGRDAMRDLLDAGFHKGDAVFCGCDMIAIGAMQAILSRGWKIPRDVRVCGFDDIEMLEHLAVPLTTFRQPIERMAAAGFGLLLDRIRNPDKPIERLVFSGDLVLRSST